MSSYPLLETIDDPAQLRRLDRRSLAQLAAELRAFIVDSVAATGGHLSSNLGTVELTIALHYAFDTPGDKLIWDVGHQTYGHKILTGRRAGMANLRQKGGIAGFPRREESEYDTFGISFTDIATLPDVLATTRSTEPLIAGIDVTDADGKAIYSTEAPRRGHYIEMEWREAMRHAGGEPWHASEGADAVQAAPIRNAFGLTLGHAVVRYRLDALNKASAQFVRNLALDGLAVAVGGTLALFLMLRWVQSRLERRLARMYGAFENGAPDARPGSFRAEAAQARAKLDDARHALVAAEASLQETADAPARAGATP